MSTHNDLLAAALYGYQAQLQMIEGKIAELRVELGTGSRMAGAVSGSARPEKRQMSAAARKRIAAAQRQRWAAYHAEHGTKAPAKKASGKRKMSAAGRKAIAEATKKRWAAYRATKKMAA
jgi:hypothetical protein